MDRLFLISVLSEDLIDNQKSIADIIKWSYENINSKYVNTYTEEKLNQLISETKIFNIINSESKHYISIWEDSIICSFATKKVIFDKLLDYFNSYSDGNYKSEVLKILKIFDYAFQMNKCIYFLF